MSVKKTSGSQLSGLAESLLAVSGFADHLQVRAAFQAGDEAPAHDRVVVREEQSDSLAGAGAGASAGGFRVRAGRMILSWKRGAGKAGAL